MINAEISEVLSQKQEDSASPTYRAISHAFLWTDQGRELDLALQNCDLNDATMAHSPGNSVQAGQHVQKKKNSPYIVTVHSDQS